MPSPSPKFQNFEPFQKRPMFCGNFLKGPKVKQKVNEIYWSWIKSK